MKKKHTIIILVIVIILLIIFFYSSNSNHNKVESQIINEYCDYPMVSLLSTAANNLIITAGLYRYGDVNQDGKINNEDVASVTQALESSLELSEDQVKLADLDEDKMITKEDLEILKYFIKNNPDLSYSIETNLEYCLNEIDDSSNCLWQEKNEFILDHDSNYYIFIKSNDIISKSYNYNYHAINYDDYIIDEVEPLA